MVAASHSGASNASTILASAQEVLDLNNNSSSPLYQNLETATYGVMGKSLGGKAAGEAIMDPAGTGAIAVALIGLFNPDTNYSIEKPALFATSDADIYQPNVLTGYNNAANDAIYAEANGISHMDLSYSDEIAAL